jgi:plastocyanin
VAQNFTASWVDNGTCSPGNNTTCRFEPSSFTVPTGSIVTWTHKGSLIHTVTSNSTLNSGLPTFDSRPIPAGSTYSHDFTIPGAYHYYCSIHPWMKGIVNAAGSTPPPPSPSMPPTVMINLGGNLGWTVKGLSTDVANLQVDHKVSVSIMPLPGVTFTPLVEQGSLPQTVNLATRVESPGTATSIIQKLLSSIPYYYLGTPVYATGPRLATTAPLSIVSTMLGRATGSISDPNSPVYTAWWVNGPLALGSPVQILTGWSSVTGDETLSLGGSIGTRNGWLVTSQFSQSLNATDPAGSASNIAFTLDLLWSFDKRDDVLLRNNVSASFAVLSTNREQVFLGNPCAPSGWCPNYAQVTVTRTMTATLNLALMLTDTDLRLNSRMNSGSQASSSPLLDAMVSLPMWGYGILGSVAAGLVGVAVWGIRRTNGKKSIPGPIPSLPS